MKMLKKMTVATLLASTVITAGCASGLTRMESREYSKMKTADVLVEEKNPTGAAVLGILPGGGSFYSGNPGIGFINLLLWPASILWDPVSGYQGSKAYNYDVTKHELKDKMNAEIRAQEDRLVAGELTNAQYIMEKYKIEDRYRF